MVELKEIYQKIPATQNTIGKDLTEWTKNEHILLMLNMKVCWSDKDIVI